MADFFKDVKTKDSLTKARTTKNNVTITQEEPERNIDREKQVKKQEVVQKESFSYSEQEQVKTQRRERRGRKPSESTMERDFISVNIGDGLREDLEFLCQRYAKQSGKKSVGLSTYIRHLVEKDIEQNNDYLTRAKQLFSVLE